MNKDSVYNEPRYSSAVGEQIHHSGPASCHVTSLLQPVPLLQRYLHSLASHLDALPTKGKGLLMMRDSQINIRSPWLQRRHPWLSLVRGWGHLGGVKGQVQAEGPSSTGRSYKCSLQCLCLHQTERKEKEGQRSGEMPKVTVAVSILDTLSPVRSTKSGQTVAFDPQRYLYSYVINERTLTPSVRLGELHISRS